MCTDIVCVAIRRFAIADQNPKIKHLRCSASSKFHVDDFLCGFFCVETEESGRISASGDCNDFHIKYVHWFQSVHCYHKFHHYHDDVYFSLLFCSFVTRERFAWIGLRFDYVDCVWHDACVLIPTIFLFFVFCFFATFECFCFRVIYLFMFLLVCWGLRSVTLHIVMDDI